MEKHKHYDIIVEWAKGAKIEYKLPDLDKWYPIKGNPSWGDKIEYRVVDPYRDIKEAYAQGKIIEVMKGDGIWIRLGCVPNWSLPPNRYRIKPEPEYIPFTFEDRSFLRNQWVKYIDNNSKCEQIISSIQEHGVTIGSQFYSYVDFIKIFSFLDDSPCGKLK